MQEGLDVEKSSGPLLLSQLLPLHNLLDKSSHIADPLASAAGIPCAVDPLLFQGCPITETSVPERCPVTYVWAMISYLATWGEGLVF